MKTSFKISLLLSCIMVANVQAEVYYHNKPIVKKLFKVNSSYGLKSFSNLDGSSVDVIAYNNNNQSLYVGSNYGNVWQYNQGSWTQLVGTGNGGTIVNPWFSIFSLAVDSNNNVYEGDALGYVQENSGSAWSILLGSNTSGTLDGTNVPPTTLLNVGGVIYAGTLYGNVWKYTGGDWVNVDGGPIEGAYIAIDALSSDSSGNIYAATSNGNVWELKGNSWTQLGGNVDSNGIAALSLDSSNNIYVSTYSGTVLAYAGGSWVDLPNVNDSNIWTMAVDSNNNLYIGTGNGNVWKYTNASGTWTAQIIGGPAADKTIDDSPVNAITFDSSGNMYVGTQGNAAGGTVWEYSSGAWTEL